MKKTIYRIISFAFLMSVGLFLLNVKVYAASNVVTISANGNTQGATISGTTDDDVVAVLIEILDEGGGIITLETHAVTNGSYNATLSCALTEGKTYTVYVVNYNGTGTPKSTSFTVPVSVTGVSLNKTTESLTTAGGTVQLVATVAPANASNQNVTWSTSNAAVATVDATGKVTAVGNGTAIITVTTVDGGKTATATITVNISSGGNNEESNNVSVTGVSLNKTTETITTAGGTVQLIATVAPANASNQNVTWSTSNASVATVDATGKVTAVGNGTAIITVTTVDGGKTASATITVSISSDNSNNNNNNNNSNNNNANDSNNSNASTNQSDSANSQVEISSPKTGDENNLLLWAFLLIGSLAAVTGMGIIKIRRKANK